MTPNLIPERRIDKNGNAVTRHVRTQGHVTARQSIPAPSSVLPATEALILTFVDSLPEYGMDGEKAGAILRELDNFNRELFSDVMDSYLGCSKDERAVWRVALNSGRPTGNFDEKHYRRMIELVQLSVALLPDAPPGYRSHKITERAEAAESITGMHPGDPEYVETKAWMIVQEIESLRPDAFEGTADTRAFIAANLEKVMPLIPELLKRRTASESVIQELISNEASSLNSGVL
jgi:hypothetical protein